MKIRIKENHWYPKWLGVDAITLMPFILLSGSLSEARINETLAHEWIHVKQVRQIGWSKFYASYLWQYLVGRFKGKSHDDSYYNISFEKEAYENQAEMRNPAEWEYEVR